MGSTQARDSEDGDWYVADPRDIFVHSSGGDEIDLSGVCYGVGIAVGSRP